MVFYDFKLTEFLNPSPHIEIICFKTLKILGFSIRLSKQLQLKVSIKALYCSLVGQSLEYRSDVRNPHTSGDAIQLERVQWKFLRFAGFILKLHLFSLSGRGRKVNLNLFLVYYLIRLILQLSYRDLVLKFLLVPPVRMLCF